MIQNTRFLPFLGGAMNIFTEVLDKIINGQFDSVEVQLANDNLKLILLTSLVLCGSLGLLVHGLHTGIKAEIEAALGLLLISAVVCWHLEEYLQTERHELRLILCNN